MADSLKPGRPRRGPVRVAVSWSGGKDAALAASLARESDHALAGLVAVVDPDHGAVRAHGTPGSVLRAQAEALGVPLALREGDWEGYEAAFRDGAASLRDGEGVEGLVFGDVDLEEHREWGERVAADQDLEAVYPLWGWDHSEVVEAAAERGLEAAVVAVRDPLDDAFLGEAVTPDLADRAAAAGASPSGEDGAYHSVVVDGPGFREALDLTAGEVRERDGYRVLGHDLRRRG